MKSLLLLAVMLFSVSASEPPEKKITIAVYPIKVLAPDKSFESYGPILTSFLVTNLSKSPKLKVKEQEMTAEVEKQLEFANSDKCDSTMCPIPAIGKAIAAQKLVVGQVAKLGSKYKVNIRVIDIEQQVIDFSVDEQMVCKEEDLDQLMDLAALDLREKFGEKVERPHLSEQSQSSPTSAPSPAPSEDPLDSQNILGILVDKNVTVTSVSSGSPCRDVIKPGYHIAYIKPNGPIGATENCSPYQTSDINDFRIQVAKIQPASTVGIWYNLGTTTWPHIVKCVIPSPPTSAPQPPAPDAPEKKVKK